MRHIGTVQLLAESGDPRLRLVDARSVDAYNGWPLNGAPRGGHIPGAKSLPAKWTAYLDWPEIVRAKGIDPRDEIVLYGDAATPTEDVGRLLGRLGYENVGIYEGFASRWCADPRFPLERLARYEHLLPAQIVASLLDGTPPETLCGGKHVICHAYYQDRTAYERGHIPGAIALDTELLESPDDWNRRSPDELRDTLRDLGIEHDTTVILYGECGSPKRDDPFPGASAGHIAAMRCAFILLYAGVSDVRLLNGGLQAWMDAGYSVSTEDVAPKRAPDFGAAVPGAPHLAVDIDEAKRILVSSEANLVCVRSPREYRGEVSGYNYIDVTGRIPGAVFGNCGSDAYHMENYRNADHTTREWHEITEMWSRAGISADKHNSFYCGTGWRGSEAFMNAWLMGWERISVFDGGWLEWSRDPANPFERGSPLHGAPEQSISNDG